MTAIAARDPAANAIHLRTSRKSNQHTVIALKSKGIVLIQLFGSVGFAFAFDSQFGGLICSKKNLQMFRLYSSAIREMSLQANLLVVSSTWGRTDRLPHG